MCPGQSNRNAHEKLRPTRVSSTPGATRASDAGGERANAQRQRRHCHLQLRSGTASSKITCRSATPSVCLVARIKRDGVNEGSTLVAKSSAQVFAFVVHRTNILWIAQRYSMVRGSCGARKNAHVRFGEERATIRPQAVKLWVACKAVSNIGI